MRLKLIACEILYREFCAAAARSVNQIDIEFLPKGLHDIGREGMNRRLAEAVAAVDEIQYDAILLGYGLCNNGLIGLAARRIPLVVARAHDCITLLLGDKHRYLDYFFSHPGVYFKSTGWIERGDRLDQLPPESIQGQLGATLTHEQLVEKYGEDNARFLESQLGDLARRYGQITYIATGVEPDGRFVDRARQEATQRGWKFDTLRGSLALLEALVNGDWDEGRFLVVPPGRRIANSHDEAIVRAE